LYPPALTLPFTKLSRFVSPFGNLAVPLPPNSLIVLEISMACPSVPLIYALFVDAE
jgi:hypothetical protein